MTKRKYDHLFTTEIVRKTGKSGYPPFKGMISHHLEEEINFQIRFTPVSNLLPREREWK